MLPGRMNRRFRFNPSANGGCTSCSGCIAFWECFHRMEGEIVLAQWQKRCYFTQIVLFFRGDAPGDSYVL